MNKTGFGITLVSLTVIGICIMRSNRAKKTLSTLVEKAKKIFPFKHDRNEEGISSIETEATKDKSPKERKKSRRRQIEDDVNELWSLYQTYSNLKKEEDIVIDILYRNGIVDNYKELIKILNEDECEDVKAKAIVSFVANPLYNSIKRKVEQQEGRWMWISTAEPEMSKETLLMNLEVDITMPTQSTIDKLEKEILALKTRIEKIEQSVEFQSNRERCKILLPSTMELALMGNSFDSYPTEIVYEKVHAFKDAVLKSGIIE